MKEIKPQEIKGYIPKDLNYKLPFKSDVDKLQGRWVRFYAQRLTELIESRQELDTGNYPLKEYEGLNIHPDRYAKGLRHGILFSIFSCRQALHKLGAGQIADTILDFDRERQGLEVKK